MRRAIVTIAVGLLLTLMGTALAAWSSIASGTATASSTNVPSAEVSATVDGETVSITWPAVTVGDATATSYTVTRYPVDGATSAQLGCTASPCMDTPGPGTWKYGVKARYNNWTGGESLSGDAVVTTTTTTPPAPAFGLELLVDTVTAFTTGNQTARLTNLPATTTAITFTIDTTVLTSAGPTGSDYSLTIPCMTNGTKTVTATATNGTTVLATATDTFTIDGLCPLSLSLVNKAGGTAGKIEQSDRIEIVWSAPTSTATVCGGWDGVASVSGSLEVAVAGSVTFIHNSNACKVQGVTTYNLGSLAIGSGYVTDTARFDSSTMTWAAATNTLTLTVGSLCTGRNCPTAVVVQSSTATFTPDADVKSASNVGATGSVSKTAQHF